ncbi:DUF4363 family protein [uncultured Flavonifractor sp.]|uniref:DUF4363 family protein n=1 Tax=uncultured Flavonifractor sp. TaxID=1193534 RepID=UPI00262888DB|nr:DUF4363 family protein [uncultured Flavonifractor sp.]
MKRLWIALALLATLLCGTLLHTWSLEGFTEELTASLEQAQRLVTADRWEEARSVTQKALETWSGRDVYLHVLLRHADTDQIYAGFQEVLALLTSGEYGEYAAANARLLTQIKLLSEAEQLTLKNVF